MPHTINGVGTWYYGKERVLRVQGTCSQCHASGQLTSYDTTNYFVFVFVPVIPLGKFRVIEECPRCQQHRRVKLKEWQELKANALAEVREQMRSDGDRSKAAIQALQVAVGFQDETILQSVASGLAADMTDNAEVQSLLGAAYCYFGHDEQAVPPLKQAIKLQDTPDHREMLAATLVRLRHPDAAEKVLQPLLAQPDEKQVGNLVMLSEGYQSVGQHDRAIDLLEQCEQLMPQLNGDKQYQQMLKKARKYKGSDKPLVSQALSSAQSGGYQEGGRGAAIARWLFPVLLLVGLAGYVFAAWRIGQSRQVYVVNGTSFPYTARIGDQSVPVGPESRVDIRLPEGEIPVSIEGRDDFPPATVELNTRFFTRPFNGDVFVINPDRTAVLARETQWYGNNLDPDLSGDWLPSAGKVLHRFDDVDYEFQEFPNQLKVSNKSKAVSKSRVAFQRRSDSSWPFLQVLPSLMSDLPAEEMASFARGLATAEPESDIAVALWGRLASAEEYEAWAQPLMEKQPVLIEVHRAYQTRMQESQPDRDLEAEYRQRLAAHPRDSGLQYLVARIVEDPHESRRLLEEAAQGSSPIPHVLNALAYDYLVQGEFPQADRYARQAYALSPDAVSFRQIYVQAALATGRVEELLTDIDRRRAMSPMDLSLIQEKLQALLAAGKLPAAEQFVTEAIAPFRAEAPVAAPTLETIFQSLLAYGRGDRAGYMRLVKQSSDLSTDNFSLAVTEGEPRQAVATLASGVDEKAESAAAAQQLLVYLLFQQQGQAAQADEQLNLAAKLLETGDKSDRLIAVALQSDQLSDAEVDRLLWASVLPEDKRTILTALGVRHPEHQSQFFDLARKLNYQKTFPQMTLAEILK